MELRIFASALAFLAAASFSHVFLSPSWIFFASGAFASAFSAFLFHLHRNMATKEVSKAIDDRFTKLEADYAKDREKMEEIKTYISSLAIAKTNSSTAIRRL